MSFFKLYHPLGLLLCILIGGISIYLATISPIDAVTMSILIGVLIGNLTAIPNEWTSGVNWSEKQLLGIAIALYGLTLKGSMLMELGFESMAIVMSTIVITLMMSRPIGRLLKIEDKLSLTVGIGTAICGSAAIVATKDIIKINETQAGISIAAINFIGTIGIFALPFLGSQILEFSTIDNGFMIGNTLQAVGQVVAAGFSINDTTGQIATIVKMGRVMMLTPLIFLLLKLFEQPNADTEAPIHLPGFVLGFILCSVIATLDLLPTDVVQPLTQIGEVCLIISMSAIGLKISVGQIREYGLSVLGAGTLLFVVQLAVSLGFVLYT